MNRRLARRNRIVLAVTGLLLLAAGIYGLARGLGLDIRLLGSAHAPLTDDGARRFADQHGWFWPVLAAATSLLALCGLWWLAVQARTGSLRELWFEHGSKSGDTRLPARVLADACEEDLLAVPDLRHGSVALTGKRSRPCLRLTVTLAADADPAIVRRQAGFAVRRLRQAVETDLPAAVRMRVTRRSGGQ